MNDSTKLLATVEEAAKRLSIGRTMVYELMQRGELRSVKLGKSRRIPITALEDFVHKLEAPSV